MSADSSRTLKSVLNEEAYTALAEHCRKANLPVEVLHKTKPGMAVMMLMLQDLDQVSAFVDEMICAWRIGDLDTIHRLFVEDMAAYPEIYDRLLKDRNLRWLPQIEAMLATEPTEFVLVGVGHMPGEDGLIAQLEAKGYTVTQVVAE